MSERTNKIGSAPAEEVIFHHLGRSTWAPAITPFAVKLETYFRAAKIQYKSVFSLKSSPKNKFPWIEYKGQPLGDTAMIMKYLNKSMDINLNSGLTPEQLGIARAIQKLVEDDMYWTLVANRWKHRYNSRDMTAALTAPSSLLTWYLKRGVAKTLYAQGTGRHSREEVHQILCDDLQALSDMLGDKNYFMGDKFTEVDCCVFGQLSQLRWDMPCSGEVKMFEETLPRLGAYCDRIKENFWPDWDECITHGGTKKATK